ncbi:MAG: hypothetical protein WC529_01270 [Candidatus Margulisiibacteriota bacterium]
MFQDPDIDQYDTEVTGKEMKDIYELLEGWVREDEEGEQSSKG